MLVTEQELSIMVKREVTFDEAEPVVEMASNIIGGYLFRDLDPDDEPWRVKESVLIVAARLLTDGADGPVVSETIGSYSYQRQQTGSAGVSPHGGPFITPEIQSLLNPDRRLVYGVDTPTPDTVADGKVFNAPEH